MKKNIEYWRLSMFGYTPTNEKTFNEICTWLGNTFKKADDEFFVSRYKDFFSYDEDKTLLRGIKGFKEGYTFRVTEQGIFYECGQDYAAIYGKKTFKKAVKSCIN